MASYSQLVSEQAQAMGVTAVPVVEEADGNASTDGKSIFINAGFMSGIERAAGEGGVRFILAHELSHVHNGMCGGHEGELFCDEFGARSIAAMGYGEKVIHSVMSELNAEATETHPAASTRAGRATKAHSAARSADMTAPPSEQTAIARSRSRTP